eukprot:10151140-Karenia_brevis.AAC.1
MGILPRALQGCAVTPFSNRWLSKLRTSVLNSLWGASRRHRCKEVVLTLLSPGHRLDPHQYVDYVSLVTLRR